MGLKNTESKNDPGWGHEGQVTFKMCTYWPCVPL